ncbi:MAG: hypothetical protein BGO54_07565 [Sphingobacteriales bacterium 46-32]|nr:MAG: hypothetical protein BGO54_07565 [Sphingobacteriales bacterium 46-32]
MRLIQVTNPKIIEMKFLFFLLCFGMISCTTAQNDRGIYIFIPEDYTGWVNIKFNDTSSSNDPILISESYLFFISDDPANFSVKSDKFEEGRWTFNYYYYSPKRIKKLDWLGYPQRNIFFEGTIGNKKRQLKEGRRYAFSFYVSKEKMQIDGLSMDNIPRNPIRGN